MSNLFRFTITITALIVLACLTAAAPAQSTDEILDIVPADSLFCVKVNNFNYTVGQLDQFLTGVSPIPMGISMVARMQLADITGNPQISGIDMSKNFAVFAFTLPTDAAQPAQTPEMFIALLVPTTDYSLFVEASPNINPPDNKGISKITATIKQPISDPNALLQVEQIGLAAKLKNFALLNMTNNYNDVASALQLLSDTKTIPLAKSLDAEQKNLSQTKPVWAYANIQAVNKNFGTKLFAKLEKAKNEISSPQLQQPGPNPAAIISAYLDILKNLLNETKSVTATLEPKPDVLKVRAGISAVPATEMASMFVTNTEAGENKLSAYLDDGAMMNFALNTNAPFWNKLAVKSVDLFSAMISGAASEEENARMKKLTADAMAALGGPFVGSVSIDTTNTQPFVCRYVSAVKDENQFNRVIDEYVKMYESGRPFANLIKEMGLATSFKITRGVETYNGVSIDSAELIMKSTDPNSPQGQMINAMYGSGFKYKWAIVNGLVVCTIGPDAASSIRKLIDIVKAGGPAETPSEIKAALALLPDAEKADLFFTYNLVRMFKMAMAIVPTPVALQPIDIPTKSNLAFAVKAADGKLVVDVAIPKEHMIEFMTFSQMMVMQQMQRMQQMQQNQQQGQPPMPIPMPPQQ